jgi:hypothetical protein
MAGTKIRIALCRTSSVTLDEESTTDDRITLVPRRHVARSDVGWVTISREGLLKARPGWSPPRPTPQTLLLRRFPFFVVY